MTFWEKYLGEHFNIGNLTVYGFNAMHVAINLWTDKWGYICFHPPIRQNGYWWKWYFYVSPDATPCYSTFAIGPGLRKEDKYSAPLRRWLLGHNFNPQLISTERNYWGYWEPNKTLVQRNYPE